ncbi:MAG: hypothetical protein GX075_03035, partial [Firmicutes bacterium]|nr:hypothetical protein [Bacillota bacterium]
MRRWTKYRPRLERTTPMTSEELIENIVAATNQSRGSVQAVLAELDAQIESALKSGRIVKLPKIVSSLVRNFPSGPPKLSCFPPGYDLLNNVFFNIASRGFPIL